MKGSTENYVNCEAVKILGRGSFGMVYEAIDIPTGTRVAVKKTKKEGRF